MAFDARQRKALTQLLKSLALDFGFTENALTAEIGDIIGQSQDVSGAGSTNDTSGGAGNAAKVLLLDAAGKADGVDLSQPTGSTTPGAGGATAAGTVCGHVRYQQPIAAETVTISAQANIANSAAVIAAQPAYPRKLQVVVTDANSSITAGIITLVGVGPGGDAINEVINIANGGTHTYTTANAFAKVTSITPSGLIGIDVGTDKLQVGVATAMGLPIPVGATSVSVYKAGVAASGAVTAADDTVGTVDTTARTIVPNTAADGTKSFDFWFSYVMPTHTHTGAAHTHTLN